MKSDFLFMDSRRMNLIYGFALKLPSWEIISNSTLIKPAISKEEFEYVMQQTHLKLKEKKNEIHKL